MTDIQSASPATTRDPAAAVFSAEMFAAFWAAPDLSRGLNILAEDIVGSWPGAPEPVQGVEEKPVFLHYVGHDSARRGHSRSGAQPGDKKARRAAAYAATSPAPMNSRAECMASWGAPTSTVGIPVRADVMGPIVEPQGRSARCS